MQSVQLSAVVDETMFKMRLDQVLAKLFNQYSRSTLKSFILDGKVKVNGEIELKPKALLLGGETIEINAQIQIIDSYKPCDLQLNIVFEDEHILVINKPADLVVHPGAGNYEGTILNALLYHYPEAKKLARCGIVHRLDKDTTGLMVIAKSQEAQTILVQKLQQRKVTREYEAIVRGVITAGGKIEKAIGRHPTKRTQMAVSPMGKPAITHYRVMQNFRGFTRLRLRLETGRTHQIRVHMADFNHPLLGDRTYSHSMFLPPKADENLNEAVKQFKRQALHAIRLSFNHPISDELLEFEAPLPVEQQNLVDLFIEDYNLHKDELDY